jgi:hypothetical protein
MSNLVIEDVVEDNPSDAEDRDEEVAAISSRLPVAVGSEGDDLHEDFDHETDGQAGTEMINKNVGYITLSKFCTPSQEILRSILEDLFLRAIFDSVILPIGGWILWMVGF